MGKSHLVETVQNEARELVKTFRKNANVSQPLPNAIHMAVLNVIWQMVASKYWFHCLITRDINFEISGKRYIEGDAEFEKFHDLNDKIFTSFATLMIPDFLPLIRQVTPAFLYKKIFCVDIQDKLIGEYTSNNMVSSQMILNQSFNHLHFRNLLKITKRFWMKIILVIISIITS